MADYVATSLRMPNFTPQVAGPPETEPAWAPDRYLWAYRFAGGEPVASLISLLRNGNISNLDSPNERTWSFDQDTLRLHRQDGTVSAVFGTPRKEGGRLVLTGLRQDDLGGTRRVQLVSRMAYGTTPVSERLLCVHSTIRCPSRTLLVVFNSGGGVFDGTHMPHFDFYNLSDKLEIDVLRFAEHEGTFARFLDKTRLVLRHIENVLEFGYRKVILLGLSAAGYVSLYMANLLSRRHPDLEVGSVVANAQLVLDDKAEWSLMQQVPGTMLSPIWTDSLDHVDFEYCDIDVLLRRHGRTNVRHVAIYDRGNPGEVFHTERLVGLPGVELMGVDLGMPHAAGVYALCDRGFVVDGVRRMMEA